MYLSAFLLGLLGEIHCVGMCGPIALILPVDRDSPWKKNLKLLLYHLGRITAYGTLGLLVGFVGKGLSLAGLQQKISLVFGILMVIAAFYPTAKFFGGKSPAFWQRFIGKLNAAMRRYLNQRSLHAMFVLGFLNGYLPCGLVYVALVGALATGDPWKGALYMMFFGLGTTPALYMISLFKSLFSVKWRRKLDKLIPFGVALVGILFILRGLGLNIMYLSPGEKHLQVNKMKEKKFEQMKEKTYRLLPSLSKKDEDEK
ncbi:MAG: sulfite exporter TauE/SafE family protein [Chlorobi bacterium]|nr:sulfite exporter TauE/SafE family protein [Chlorobiota bacterium]